MILVGKNYGRLNMPKMYGKHARSHLSADATVLSLHKYYYTLGLQISPMYVFVAGVLCNPVRLDSLFFVDCSVITSFLPLLAVLELMGMPER